jgi:DNA-binding transcriptional ArsR family regulator
MTETKPMSQTTISWDIGTAYEFFMSLQVLHIPEYYGIRASWAAGVRSRIPAVERKFLEEVMPFLGFPSGWVYRLPEPKDAITAMWAIRQIPAAERIIKVFEYEVEDHDMTIYKILLDIAHRHSWTEKDLDAVSSILDTHEKLKRDEGSIRKYLDWWASPDEFGESFLKALQAYYQAFFEAEEKRVGPVLQAGLEIAKEKAKRLNPLELIIDLSQGVRFDESIEKELKELIIVPAFWTTPLVALEKIGNGKFLFLFGARPATMAAIPGELVPDGLIRTLKALADPTRLKIMRYITQEELTPSELARRLSLRAPTVTHHLNELRLSGLVNMTLKGQEKFYTSRLEALDITCTSLHEFLENKSIKVS